MSNKEIPQEPKLDENGGFAKPSDKFCSRFLEDLTGSCACRPSFRAVDGSRDIDIPASFSPKSWGSREAKLLNLGVAAATFYLGVGLDPRLVWLAYGSNWNVVVSSAYLLLSFINSFVPVAGPDAGHTVVGLRVKSTWILFTISANIGILVTIAFWTMIYNGKMDWKMIFPHGLLQAAVLEDGFLINTIPIRLRHYLEFVVPFALSYFLWSYLDSALGIGTPDKMNNNYAVLDWSAEPGKTATLAAVLIFAVSPVLQVVLWLISGCRRRYKSDSADDDATNNYIEMSSDGVKV